MSTTRHYSKLFLRKSLLIITILLIAMISLIHSFYDAINGSWDMQWSPSTLLLSGVNPYQWWLNGNPNQQIIMHQQPNYLHTLYVLMLPLASLSWHTAKIIWALLNISFGISIAYYLGKKENLSTITRLIVGLFFICSASFQNAIASGQQSLFVLFFTMAAFYCQKNAFYIFNASLAITKYSFAPPLILYEYYRNGFKKIIGIMLVTMIFILLFSAIVKENPITVTAYPFIISKTSALGQADIMSLCMIFLPIKLSYLPHFLSLLCAWFLMHIYYKTHYHRWVMLDFAYVNLVSLASFKHLNYDFIFLLPLLISAIHFKKAHRLFIFIVIFWFWFGAKLFYNLLNNPSIWVYFIFNQFLLLLMCIYIVNQYSRDLAQRRLSPAMGEVYSQHNCK